MIVDSYVLLAINELYCSYIMAPPHVCISKSHIFIQTQFFFLSKHATWSVLHHIETTCGSSATLQAVAAPCRVSSLFTKSPCQCHPLLVHPLPMGLQRGRCPVAHHAPQYLYPHQQKVI